MIIHGDLFDVLPTLEANSIDSCVTDPPYGISFMAKDWDVPGGIAGFPMRRRVETDAVNTGASRQGGRQRSGPDFAKRQARDARAFEDEAARWGAEVFRVLKPGAHLVSFGGTRMFHRMASGIEDAGFEIRDCLSWLYGQGFPKSLNLPGGLGTALKPSWEPIILARKPTEGTVAANVEKHGTAALNIDACRLEGTPRETGNREGEPSAERSYAERGSTNFAMRPGPRGGDEMGRWPANVLLDEEAAALLDEQTGELISGANPTRRNGDKFRDVYGAFKGQDCEPARGLDVGGASRFYYVAKPSREERDYGTEGLTARQRDESRKEGNPGGDNPRNRGLQPRGNFHPTVKPVELMRWLVRLVTPPDGVVLDPFTGSGTTGMACRYEHRRFIGIEKEADYIAIAERRIAAVAPLFGEEETA